MKSGNFADAVRTARLKRRCLFLRHLVYVAKHLAGTGEVETALRLRFTQRREDVVRAVDVHIHRGEAVGEAFRDETLRREVVTLVEFVLAQYVENARITLETRRVQPQAFDQMADTAEACVWCFERDEIGRAHV